MENKTNTHTRYTSLNTFKSIAGEITDFEGYWWCVSGKDPKVFLPEGKVITSLPDDDCSYTDRIVEGHLFSKSKQLSVHLLCIDGENMITVFDLNKIYSSTELKLGKEEELPAISRLSKSNYGMQRLTKKVPLEEGADFHVWQEVAQVFTGFKTKENGKSTL